MNEYRSVGSRFSSSFAFKLGVAFVIVGGFWIANGQGPMPCEEECRDCFFWGFYKDTDCVGFKTKNAKGEFVSLESCTFHEDQLKVKTVHFDAGDETKKCVKLKDKAERWRFDDCEYACDTAQLGGTVIERTKGPGVELASANTFLLQCVDKDPTP